MSRNIVCFVSVLLTSSLWVGCDAPEDDLSITCEGACDVSGEDCTNGIDDDGNLLTDCLDRACASNQACEYSDCRACDNSYDIAGNVPEEAKNEGEESDWNGYDVMAETFESEQDVDWYRWRAEDTWTGSLVPRATLDLMESDNAVLGFEACAFFVPDSEETEVSCSVGSPTTDPDLGVQGCCAVTQGSADDPMYYLELDVGSAFHDDSGYLYLRVTNLGGICDCGWYWVQVEFGL